MREKRFRTRHEKLYSNICMRNEALTVFLDSCLWELLVHLVLQRG
jgi:hypothetical protein